MITGAGAEVSATGELSDNETILDEQCLKGSLVPLHFNLERAGPGIPHPEHEPTSRNYGMFSPACRMMDTIVQPGMYNCTVDREHHHENNPNACASQVLERACPNSPRSTRLKPHAHAQE